MVCLCTDGLANVGLGALDSNDEAAIEESKKFYNELEQLAVASGVLVNVISIKGEECKLEILGKMADATNGNVKRVNPEELSKDFANIFKDDLVATQVKLEIALP